MADIAVQVTDSNAPGAMPKGTRIRKCSFEKGDGHAIGDLGTIGGSLCGPDGQYVYVVFWDDNPKLPVHCLGYKIEKVA
jgi:hypothetical protein